MSHPNASSATSKSVQDQRKETESNKGGLAEDGVAVGTSPDKGQPKLSEFGTADHEGAVADVSNTETLQYSEEDWVQVYEKKNETTVTQPMNLNNLEEREPVVDTDNELFHDSKSVQLGQETITKTRSPQALATALPESTESDRGQPANQGINSSVEESNSEVGQSSKLTISNSVEVHEPRQSSYQGTESPEKEYSLNAHAETVYRKENAEQSCREMGYTDKQIKQAKQEYQKDRDPNDSYSGENLAKIIMQREEETEEGFYSTVATVRDSGHPDGDGSSHKIEVEVPLRRSDCCDKQDIRCKFVYM